MLIVVNLTAMIARFNNNIIRIFYTTCSIKNKEIQTTQQNQNIFNQKLPILAFNDTEKDSIQIIFITAIIVSFYIKYTLDVIVQLFPLTNIKMPVTFFLSLSKCQSRLYYCIFFVFFQQNKMY